MKRRKGSGMWDLVNEMWPLDTRPRLLQDRKTAERMSIAEISQFKEHYEKEEEKKGAGSAVYWKDRKLKPVSFRKGKDDGLTKLHAVRFQLRMPLCAPKKYWHKMPARREVYRHFPLAHLGMEGQVSEATVVRMHDRRVPITLDMLYKGNAGRDSKAEKADWLEPTEVRHLQEAILNYVTLLNALWPVDYAGLVLMRVLVEANWGAAAGGNHAVLEGSQLLGGEKGQQAAEAEAPRTGEAAAGRAQHTRVRPTCSQPTAAPAAPPRSLVQSGAPTFRALTHRQHLCLHLAELSLPFLCKDLRHLLARGLLNQRVCRARTGRQAGQRKQGQAMHRLSAPAGAAAASPCLVCARSIGPVLCSGLTDCTAALDFKQAKPALCYKQPAHPRTCIKEAVAQGLADELAHRGLAAAHHAD